MNINSVNKIGISNDLGLFQKTDKKDNSSFNNILDNALNNVSRLQNEADSYALKLAAGEVENIHEAMIAAQKAEISLDFLISIRNKVLDAYREIMRMQI